MKSFQTNRGLVRTLVVILIALLLLSYFGLNIRSIVDSETIQENWAFVRELAVNVWSNHMKPALFYLYSAIFPEVSLNQ